MATTTVTTEQATAVGQVIGIDWNTSQLDVEQSRSGMDVKLEHGARDPDTNVTDDDLELNGKIARVHLKEFPDYFDRLQIMESQAHKDWDAKSSQSA